MPRRRKDANEDAPIIEGVMGSEPQTEAARSAKPRLSITMKENGEIDFESMRGDTKEKFMKALSSMPKASGIEAPKGPVINRKAIPLLYDTLAKGIQMAGGLIFGWPEELKVLIRYSDEEKEALTEPTAALMEKYAKKLVFYLEHQEEFAFAQALATQSQAMVQRAVILYSTSSPKSDVTGAPIKDVPEGTAVGEA